MGSRSVFFKPTVFLLNCLPGSTLGDPKHWVIAARGGRHCELPDDLAPPFEGVPGGAEEPQAARGVHPIEAHLPGAGRSKVKPLIRSG